ncbi:MAG TPA: type II toxin-antitoxin system HicA family toxin [Phycisphaerae bacterium]|nr:type II toxin-antitoxin system HicA family toxin [Phycisphaerae bacterium]HQL73205.1 type II toxin-antitoxin system HicA family toxin [Phycisphaerae bacterium]
MPKLTPLPTSRVLRTLERAGWRLRRDGGSKHHVLNHPDIPGIVTVPRHPRVKPGTLRSIIRQAGLTVKAFLDLFR